MSTASPKKNKMVLEKKATITYDDEGSKMINQYQQLMQLGKGAFGKVKLVVCSKTNLKFAMKIQSKKKLRKKVLTSGVDTFSMLQKEIAIMKKV